MGAVGKPYPPNLPPCRGKVAWPKAMTDEGASGDGRDGQRPFLFPCWKKKRFLESKEKGAFGNWGAVRCPAAACVFTPPWRTGPGRYGLCGRNRERRHFYLAAAFVVGVAAWVGGRPKAAPTHMFCDVFVGAACGRPPRHMQHHVLCGARRPRRARDHALFCHLEKKPPSRSGRSARGAVLLFLGICVSSGARPWSRPPRCGGWARCRWSRWSRRGSPGGRCGSHGAHRRSWAPMSRSGGT